LCNKNEKIKIKGSIISTKDVLLIHFRFVFVDVRILRLEKRHNLHAEELRPVLGTRPTRVDIIFPGVLRAKRKKLGMDLQKSDVLNVKFR
jgi:hypothetical protein